MAFEQRGRHKVVRALSLDKHPDLRDFLGALEGAWNQGPDAGESQFESAAPPPDSADPPRAPSAPEPAAPLEDSKLDTQVAVAGWYLDPWTTPDGSSTPLRWWDGASWTGYVHPPIGPS